MTRGGLIGVRRYSFTKAATPLVRERRGQNGVVGPRSTEICWAKTEVAKILKWVGPVALGAYQAVEVHFTYRLVDVQPWARDAGVVANWAYTQRIIDGAEREERRMGLQLTSEGWE